MSTKNYIVFNDFYGVQQDENSVVVTDVVSMKIIDYDGNPYVKFQFNNRADMYENAYEFLKSGYEFDVEANRKNNTLTVALVIPRDDWSFKVEEYEL